MATPTSTPTSFGLELLTKLYQTEVELKSQKLVIFLHWKLLTCDLRNVGLGEHFGAKEVA